VYDNLDFLLIVIFFSKVLGYWLNLREEIKKFGFSKTEYNTYSEFSFETHAFLIKYNQLTESLEVRALKNRDEGCVFIECYIFLIVLMA